MPIGHGMWDHRLFVINFLTQSLIGTKTSNIVRSGSMRLNTWLSQVADDYTEKAEKLILSQRCIERLVEAHTSEKSALIVKEKINAIDKESRDYFLSAKKNCRKIKAGRISFSPEVSVWICCSQVYRFLLRYQAKKIRNRRNLKRAARRCKITNLFRLSLCKIK